MSFAKEYQIDTVENQTVRYYDKLAMFVIGAGMSTISMLIGLYIGHIL